jgi:hypothetical protein
MGCDQYTVSGWVQEEQKWKDGSIHFPDTDERATCLCTFPSGGRRIDLQEMRSLAMLGAAVVMQHHKHEEYRYLPGDLPEWIVDEIDRVILGRRDDIGSDG